ncbi:hypothetical protein NDU88_002056 [Pleurodeles waltl]|uniref:Uncharacterized protein n=1 Tax=Pleurodeles waltl TaxID=8319 RepID=A0AAV7VDH4_PLEWA|nr:hypothetical protein NDU88_002056 [Pleurodeles waltl]
MQLPWDGRQQVFTVLILRMLWSTTCPPSFCLARSWPSWPSRIHKRLEVAITVALGAKNNMEQGSEAPGGVSLLQCKRSLGRPVLSLLESGRAVHLLQPHAGAVLNPEEMQLADVLMSVVIANYAGVQKLGCPILKVTMLLGSWRLEYCYIVTEELELR